jgi:glyoxylase-like metal-dependent hydrolase (beta-lactamase superfamily II)
MSKHLLALTFALAACAPTLDQLPATADETAPPAENLADEIVPTRALTVERFTSDAAGFDTHSYWVDTGREVVVFDAQFTDALAERLAAQIRSRTRSPIRYVVITHPNPDKFNGATVFRRLGATVIASARTAAAIPGVHAYKRRFFVDVARMFTAQSYPAEPVIDRTFTGTLRLPLAQGEILLRELRNPGVSSTQTVAWIPGARSLVVGDLVHHRAHAWLEGGIVDNAPTPALRAWGLALEELRAYRGATVLGGRGESAPVELAVRAQQSYLRTAVTLIDRYLAELGARTSELSTERAGEHHRALAARFAQAFPDHALPYMIEYGVYGLVQQRLAERARAR